MDRRPQTTSDCLLVFAKYPEPGQCKTRLASQIGDVAAAKLQAEMTHRTLAWAAELSARNDTCVQVHFAGGSTADMQALFGKQWKYIPQTSGSLGQRLTAASLGVGTGDELKCEAYSGSANGLAHLTTAAAPVAITHRKIAIVGTDCPGLTPAVVSAAMRRLHDHDVCFVPALDGGYALVAFNLPELCCDGTRSSDSMQSQLLLETLFAAEEATIDWGTDRVLLQTLERLIAAHLRVCLLAPLGDVDRPEDLRIWELAKSGSLGPADPPELSVIVPVVGHEPQLIRTLESVAAAVENDAVGNADRPAKIELLVCAAGDVRQTLLDIAMFTRRFPVQFLTCDPSRGQQLNCGVGFSCGRRLLFLHADTQLPSGYWPSIRGVLDRPAIALGAFQLRIDSAATAARVIERGVSMRSKLGLPYGDQGLFMDRTTYDQLGGFRDMPIMEDYELVRRARRLGKIAIADQAVVTSARRWEKLGAAKTTAINQLMLLGYHLGVSPARLAAFYQRRRAVTESAKSIS